MKRDIFGKSTDKIMRMRAQKKLLKKKGLTERKKRANLITEL